MFTEQENMAEFEIIITCQGPFTGHRHVCIHTLRAVPFTTCLSNTDRKFALSKQKNVYTLQCSVYFTALYTVDTYVVHTGLFFCQDGLGTANLK